MCVCYNMLWYVIYIYIYLVTVIIIILYIQVISYYIILYNIFLYYIRVWVCVCVPPSNTALHILVLGAFHVTPFCFGTRMAYDCMWLLSFTMFHIAFKNIYICIYIYMQFCATVSKVAIILPIVVPMANVNPFGAST